MGIIQGHWPTDLEGLACAGVPHDDEGEVCQTS